MLTKKKPLIVQGLRGKIWKTTSLQNEAKKSTFEVIIGQGV